MSDPRVGSPTVDAAQAAQQERARLAALEAQRAQEAAQKASQTGQAPTVTDKAGVLERDTVAKEDADLMASYGKYAQADGTITEGDFERLFAEVHGADAPGVGPELNQPITRKELDPAITEVEKAQKGYDAAKGTYDQRNKELGEALGRFGPGMTADEQKAYTDKFWADPKNAGAKTDVATAETALKTTLEKNQDLLVRAVHDGNVGPAEFETIMKANAALAHSTNPENAKVAEQFGLKVLNTSNELAQQRVDVDYVMNEILGPASEATLPGKIQDNGGNAAKPFDDLQAQLKQIQSKYVKPGKEIKEKFAKIGEIAEQAKGIGAALKKPALDAMADLKKLREDFQKKGGIGKSLALTGLVASSVQFGKDFKDGKVVEAFKDAVDFTKNGFEAWVGASKFVTGIAEKGGPLVAETLGRVAPVLGIASGALSLLTDAQKGDALKFGADAIGVVGSVVALANPLAGALIVGVGAIVAAGVDIYKDKTEGRKKRAEQTEALKSINPELAHFFENPDEKGAALKRITDQYPMTPQQVQTLIKQGFGPDLQDPGQGNATESMLNTLLAGTAGGQFPHSAFDVFQELAKQYPSPQYSDKDRQMAVAGMGVAVAAVAEYTPELKWNRPGAPDNTTKSSQWWNDQLVSLTDPQAKGHNQAYQIKDPMAQNGAKLLGAWLVRTDRRAGS
ncbi:MAG: hypothetical protein JWM80_5787 [Cyanobacteria bacterium RYN_339]|nr:hypothetical protein [Cyanobacteria bacterium RYN_339]